MIGRIPPMHDSEPAHHEPGPEFQPFQTGEFMASIFISIRQLLDFFSECANDAAEFCVSPAKQRALSKNLREVARALMTRQAPPS